MIPKEEPLLATAVAEPPATAAPASARTVLVASAAATLLLYNIPVVGRFLAWPLVLLSTLAHEMGHGLTALILGGRFLRLVMWPDGAGVAEIDLTGFDRIREALSSAGGLVGPAVAAALCFLLGRTGRGARACLLGLGIFLCAAEVLVVRNLFGFFFVGTLAALCLVGGRRLPQEGAQLAVVFVGVQLALSVFSRADYLFSPGAVNPEGSFPSDVMRMQHALWLPYWFWGALCGAFSVAVLVWGIGIYWRR